MEYPNPTMIVLARESRGETQTSLSNTIQIPQSTLSSIEKGTTHPSIEVVDRVATALDYPRSFFYQGYEYRNLPVTFFRKRVRASAKAITKIQARLNVMRFRIALLLEGFDMKSPRTLPEVNATDGLSPETIARELRIAWHLRPGPIENLVEVVESAGVFVVRTNFLQQPIFGISFYQREDNIPPIIFVSRESPVDRMRWTIAHELGHLILHSHQPIPSESSEKEADAFASEFLMPTRDIRGQLATNVNLQALAQLKPHWRVSMQALLTKAKSTGSIGPRKAQLLWTQMNKYGYRKNEPVKLSSEEPSLLSRLVETHLSAPAKNEEVVRTLLHSSIADFREQFRAATRGPLYAVQ